MDDHQPGSQRHAPVAGSQRPCGPQAQANSQRPPQRSAWQWHTPVAGSHWPCGWQAQISRQSGPQYWPGQPAGMGWGRGGEWKGVSRLRARHGSPQRRNPLPQGRGVPGPPPRTRDRPLNRQPNLLGHSSLPASDSELQKPFAVAQLPTSYPRTHLEVLSGRSFGQSHTEVGFHPCPFLPLTPYPHPPPTPTGGELSILSVDPSPDGDCEGHKKSHICP